MTTQQPRNFEIYEIFQFLFLFLFYFIFFLVVMALECGWRIKRLSGVAEYLVFVDPEKKKNFLVTVVVAYVAL